MGISEQTFYRWKKKFAGLGVAERRRLKQLEDENRKHKQLVANLSLDKKMLRMLFRESSEASSAEDRGDATACSLRRGGTIGVWVNLPAAQYAALPESPQRSADLRIRLRDLARARVRYGYRRLHILLKREGWQVNHKLIYRLYYKEGLQMRTKMPRRQ
jgi:hypothetical protein